MSFISFNSTLSTILFILVIVLFLFSGPAAAQQDTTATDSTLLRQIEEQLGDNNGDEESSGERSPTQRVQSLTNDMNPNISGIGDFRSLYKEEGERNIDAFVQGVELSFISTIDPYARAEFYPVFEGEEGELNAKIEEAFVQTLSLPFNLQLKAGKFRQTFGRMNLVHRHALPVIDVPVVYENFFGEAQIDQGFSLSWLIPNPAFYQELVFEYTQGPDESPVFARSEGNELLKMLHFKNFWTLSDNATFELGFSGAIGENDSTRISRLGGINLTYKWKPLRQNTYKSFEWQTEFFFSNVDLTPEESVDSWGMYSWIQYQLARRWYLTGMYSYSNKPFDSDVEEQGIYANIGWYATEFQKFEFGPRLLTQSGFDESDFGLRIRWVFVIGAHGAHQY